MEPFEVIQEDEDIIVCYKPAGIATQTKQLGRQDMESLLRNYRTKKGEPPYIGIVHRLDQPVEGVMVFAKNPKAAADLSRQVKERTIGKYYYAVIRKSEASTLQEQGMLTDFMLSDERKNISYIVDKDTPNAKKAKLEYRVIGERGEYLCLDITLHTGRHHQIRAQLANRNCPIAGDTKYANPSPQEKQQLALCSYRIEFCHPSKQKSMDFRIAPKGALFGAFLDNIGKMA